MENTEKKTTNNQRVVNKKGQFATIEEAVKFKNDELIKTLKGIDWKTLNKQ